MHTDWPAMPESAERGYAIYATSGARSISETARILGAPRATVDKWASRYRWRDRVASEDVDERDANIAAAYARMARALPSSVATLEAALAGEDVTRQRLAAAFGILDRFGVSPIHRGALDVRTRSASPSAISDADLARMLEAGDVATLLALASGRPIPQLPSVAAIPAETGDADADAGRD